jgi:hypothetical protein
MNLANAIKIDRKSGVGQGLVALSNRHRYIPML